MFLLWSASYSALYTPTFNHKWSMQSTSWIFNYPADRWVTASRDEKRKQNFLTLTSRCLSEERFHGAAVMSLIKKTHWYSAADVNTVCGREDDRQNGAWINTNLIERWRLRTLLSLHTIRMWGNSLYLMFVFYSSKTAGLLNPETAVMSPIYTI